MGVVKMMSSSLNQAVLKSKARSAFAYPVFYAKMTKQDQDQEREEEERKLFGKYSFMVGLLVNYQKSDSFIFETSSGIRGISRKILDYLCDWINLLTKRK